MRKAKNELGLCERVGCRDKAEVELCLCPGQDAHDMGCGLDVCYCLSHEILFNMPYRETWWNPVLSDWV